MEALVRLFFVQGKITDLEESYARDPAETARLIFYWRDKRLGLGRKRLFHLAFRWLVEQDPSFLYLLPQVPSHGSWKDLVIIASTVPIAMEPIACLFAQQLLKDREAMCNGHRITTAAKWYPTNHAVNGRSQLTRTVETLLQVNEEGMRVNYLSPLRHYLQITERHLSTHQLINYSKVPFNASQRYTQTFKRLDPLWKPSPLPPPHSLLETVQQVLKGRVTDIDKYWNRYRKGASAIGLAVVCDPQSSDPSYPITFAGSVGKKGIYTYSDPSIEIKFPSTSSLLLQVGTLQAISSSSQLSLNGIVAECIVVVTSRPLPSPLPVLAPGQRLVWWHCRRPVAIKEHGMYCIEICGFTPKLFSTLSKGHLPSLKHIVASTLNNYVL